MEEQSTAAAAGPRACGSSLLKKKGEVCHDSVDSVESGCSKSCLSGDSASALGLGQWNIQVEEPSAHGAADGY